MKSRFIREQKTICGKEYMEVDLLHVSPAEHRASIRRKKACGSAESCGESFSFWVYRIRFQFCFRRRGLRTWQGG